MSADRPGPDDSGLPASAAISTGPDRGPPDSREGWGAEPPTVAQFTPLFGSPEPTHPLSPHDLLEEIGHGAMGVVHKARSLGLGRLVALKSLKAGTLAGIAEVERFYREARAAASLRHPHLIPIYEVGTFQDRHCYTMALALGGNLQQRRDQFADPRDAATLVEKVARGVGAAHHAGIVHRDLKPANVLFDENGQPLVGDFGLAKFLFADPDLTMTGQILGTPAYMAPEQATGRQQEVGPAADVWALGVILYELLTGRRPFDGQSNTSPGSRPTLDAVPPGLLKPELSAPLEWIVLKCLAHEPADRYPDADELADDLRRWLDGQTVRAKPPSTWRRLVRLARRHIAVWAFLPVLLLLAAIGVASLLAPRPAAADLDADLLAAVYDRTDAGDAYDWHGGEKPFRHFWRLGKGVAEQDQLSGTVTLSTWDLCLIELVPDVRHDRYRLRAEIRHETSPAGAVGLYARHGVRGGLHGAAEHHIVALIFAESGADAPHLLAEARRVRVVRPALNNAARLVQGTLRPAADRWHTLEMTVGPEQIELSCDGKLMLPATDRDLARTLGPLYENNPAPAPAAQLFPIRGGVGLYLHQGVASVRRLTLTPLD